MQTPASTIGEGRRRRGIPRSEVEAAGEGIPQTASGVACGGEAFASANPSTVLVVEDNPDLAYLWERYLELMGCRVVSTPQGDDALALAQRENPAVVILDIMLPGKDGWEVMRDLKADRATRDIPVVICSALDEQARGMAEGASAYMRKPVTMGTFVSTLSGVGVS